jgi:hypothetical protein
MTRKKEIAKCKVQSAKCKVEDRRRRHFSLFTFHFSLCTRLDSSFPRRRSGFAVLAALTLMVIASTAAAVLTWQFTHEGARTRQSISGAQLRQLLTVSTLHASIWVDRPAMSEATLSINLPAVFAERGAAVRLKLIPQPRSLERHVEAEAVIDGVSLRQTLRFVKTRTSWALAEAILQR